MTRQVPASLKFYSVLHETIFTFKAPSMLLFMWIRSCCWCFHPLVRFFACYILFIANILILSLKLNVMRCVPSFLPFYSPENKIKKQQNLNPARESLWCERAQKDSEVSACCKSIVTLSLFARIAIKIYIYKPCQFSTHTSVYQYLSVVRPRHAW